MTRGGRHSTGRRGSHPTRIGHRLGVFAVFAFVTWAGTTAAASAQQPATPTITNERARAHFELAVGYFETAEYEQALTEFQRAYELSHQADVLYNLHLVHERMGNLARAIETLEQYLRDATGIEDRPTIEARLTALRARLERSRQPAAGTGQTGTGGTAQPPTTGRRPAGSTGGAGTSTRPGDEPRGGGAPVGAIVSFAAAGAGAVAFGVFGALALAEDGSVYDDCGATSTCTDDDVSGIRTMSLVADIGLGVAVVGAAVGVVLLVTSSGDEASPASRGRTRSSRRTAVRMAPIVGPHGAGGTIGMRF